MKRILATTAAIFGVILLASAPANAASFGPITKLTYDHSGAAQVIKIHSRRAAHDILHDYGFSRVKFLSKRIAYDGKPVFKFRACLGNRAYRIKVNYYGNIVRQRRSGWCFNHRRDHDYRQRDY